MKSSKSTLKEVDVKELYLKMNVPFPQVGNSYEALALVPDFKTRAYQGQATSH